MSVRPSTARECQAAVRAMGQLEGIEEILGGLFEQGKLPRTMVCAQALDALKRARLDLEREVAHMRGRTL